MRRLPKGLFLAAAAAACAGIAMWALQPARGDGAKERDERGRGTSASVALEPPFSRRSLEVTAPQAAALEAPRPPSQTSVERGGASRGGDGN